MSSRVAGTVILIAACSLYAYYTAWVLITPFIEEGQPVLRLFPPRYFAIAAPVLAGVALFGTTLVTLGGFLVSAELAKLGQQRADAKSKRQ